MDALEDEVDASSWVINKLERMDSHSSDPPADPSHARLDQIHFIDDSDGVDDELDASKIIHSVLDGDMHGHSSTLSNPVDRIMKEERRLLLQRVDSLHEEKEIRREKETGCKDDVNLNTGHEIHKVPVCQETCQQNNTVTDSSSSWTSTSAKEADQTSAEKNQEENNILRKHSFLESILHGRRKPEKRESFPSTQMPTTKRRIKRNSESGMDLKDPGGSSDSGNEPGKDHDRELTSLKLNQNLLDVHPHTETRHASYTNFSPLPRITNSKEDVNDSEVDLDPSHTKATDTSVIVSQTSSKEVEQSKSTESDGKQQTHMLSTMKQRETNLPKILHKVLHHKEKQFNATTSNSSAKSQVGRKEKVKVSPIANPPSKQTDASTTNQRKDLKNNALKSKVNDSTSKESLQRRRRIHDIRKEELDSENLRQLITAANPNLESDNKLTSTAGVKSGLAKAAAARMKDRSATLESPNMKNRNVIRSIFGRFRSVSVSSPESTSEFMAAPFLENSFEGRNRSDDDSQPISLPSSKLKNKSARQSSSMTILNLPSESIANSNSANNSILAHQYKTTNTKKLERQKSLSMPNIFLKAKDIKHKSNLRQNSNEGTTSENSADDKDQLTQQPMACRSDLIKVPQTTQICDDPSENIDPMQNRTRRSTLANIQAFAAAVFTKKAAVGGVDRSKIKVLDMKKDLISRLKHLRIITEKSHPSQARDFYEQNYSYIYHIFHDSYKLTEPYQLQKVNQKQKEDLDLVFFTFEKILCLLPDLIHRRWQYHSIGRIFQKLLQFGHDTKMFEDGLRLFIIWYSILMDNASEECHLYFKRLVPYVDTGSVIVQSNHNSQRVLRMLLLHMVTQVLKVEWLQGHAAFRFLFDNFFNFYLLNLFPSFKETNFSDHNLEFDLPHPLESVPDHSALQATVIDWLIEFVHVGSRAKSLTKQSFGIVSEKVFRSQNGNVPPHEDGIPADSHASHPHTAGSVTDVPERHTFSDRHREMVHHILFTSKKNFNIVLEILHQAMLHSIGHGSMVKKVLFIFKLWLKDENKPVFLEEPNVKLNQASSESDKASTAGNAGHDVRIGLQKLLQIFFVHSSSLFMCNWNDMAIAARINKSDLITSQIDICKRTLDIFRYIVMNISMQKTTWIQLLTALMRVISHVVDPANGQSVADQMAKLLSQTLMVTWIRAALTVTISKDLWDQLLSVMSSLTDSSDVIQEWANSMDMLTKIFVQTVYHVNLKSPSISSQLSEPGARRLRGKKKDPQSDPVEKQKPINVDDSSTIKAGVATMPNVAVTSGHTPLLVRRLHSRSRDSSPFHKVDVKHSASVMSYLSILAPSENLYRSSSESNLYPTSDQKEKQLKLINREAKLLNPSSSTEKDDELHKDAAETPTVNFELTFDKDIQSPNSTSEATNESNPVTFEDNQSISSSCLMDDCNQSVKSLPNSAICNCSAEFECDHQILNCIEAPLRDKSQSNASRSTDSPADRNSSYSVFDLETIPSIDDSSKRSLNNQEQTIINMDKFNFEEGSRHLTRATVSISSILSNFASFSSLDSPPVADSNYSPHFPRATRGDGDADSMLGAFAYDSPPINLEPTNGRQLLLSIDDEAAEVPPVQDSRESSRQLGATENGGSGETHGSEILENTKFIREISEISTIEERTVDISLRSSGRESNINNELLTLVWNRMLGILGDVNKITDADTHAMVFSCLRSISDILVKVQSSPEVAKDKQAVSSMVLITPWLFQAVCLPDKYLKGKLFAYMLLCECSLQPNAHLPESFLLRFYSALHHGLVRSHHDVAHNIVRYCAPRLFTLPLGGVTVLLMDFVHAITSILVESGSQYGSQIPRSEAMSLLGSLICFPNHYGDIPVLKPSGDAIEIMSASPSYFKDCVMKVLLAPTSSYETLQVTNCTRLCSLAIYLYEELTHGTMHPRVPNAIATVLIAITNSDDHAVKLMAVDVLSLLCDHASYLFTNYPEQPNNIMGKLISHVETFLWLMSSLDISKERKVIVSILFCLLEWCMNSPPLVLLSAFQSDSHGSVLEKMFGMLDLMQNAVLKHLRSVNVDHNSNYSVARDLSTSRGSLDEQNSAGMQDYVALMQAAKATKMHLINHFGNFPMYGSEGFTRMDCSVNETDADELTSDVLSRNNVQFLVWNNERLISLVEYPEKDTEDVNGIVTGKTMCRVIVRDLSGKWCWDMTSLFSTTDQLMLNHDTEKRKHNAANNNSSTCVTTSIQPTDADLDILDNILSLITFTSPECCTSQNDNGLNSPFQLPTSIPSNVDSDVLVAILEQKAIIDSHVTGFIHDDPRFIIQHAKRPSSKMDPAGPFQMCRQAVAQLGYFLAERRNYVDLLKKDDRLVRELKHLDNQKCRETHKIAVIYVASGQDDKTSILSNSKGSPAYDSFLSGLGKMVELEFHKGFMGGLQKNKSNGVFAPYYATSTTEVLFHVSTMMPSSQTDNSHIPKMRHLGNDEVHIVWSEHDRDYHHDVIPTEFGDVLIIIYPMRNGLFRIQILKKSQVGQFGPLYDGAILDARVLPGLVRATAINAGRAIHATRSYFRTFYEERESCIKKIATECKVLTTYESFVSDLFVPGLRTSLSPSMIPMTAADLQFPIPVNLNDSTDHPEIRRHPQAKTKKSKVDAATSFLKHRSKSSASSATHSVRPFDGPEANV